MFRADKQHGNCYFLQDKDGKTIMKKDDGSVTVVPDIRDWNVGAAYLSKCFGVTVQRIYQLRDLGVLTPEEKKDRNEEVYNLHLAIKDMLEFKRHGKFGIYSGGELKKPKKSSSSDVDPFDFSDYGIEF